MAAEDPARKGESYGGYAEEDDDDMQWSSRLIPAIVALNVVVFAVVMYVNDCPKHTPAGLNGDRRCLAKFLGRFSFQPTDENPLFGPSSATLKKTGALDWQSIVHRHQGWRLISCIWLHAGIIHLLTNMLSLVFIGVRLEQQFGFVKIGAIYLVSGFGGSVLSSLLIQNRTSVGASGSLFGLLGAMLAELITNWTMYTNKGAALFTLSIIAAINLAIGVLPFVNNIAHIGGFLTGSLLGFVLLPRPRLGRPVDDVLPVMARLRSKYKAHQIVLWASSLTLLLSGFAVALVMVFGGRTAYSRCSWCRYLSCVPTSKWKCDM